MQPDLHWHYDQNQVFYASDLTSGPQLLKDPRRMEFCPEVNLSQDYTESGWPREYGVRRGDTTGRPFFFFFFFFFI